MRAHSAAGLVVMVLIATGCQTPAGSNTASAPQANATTAHVVPEQWLGRWDGPEGTFLNLSRNGEKYTVVIQDLDGPRKLRGRGG